MQITRLLTAAFVLAEAGNRELQEKWIAISCNAGARVPASLLMMSVQRVGRLDVLLRALEAESRASEPGDGPTLGSEYLAFLSEAWVGSLYEIVRSMEERQVHPAGVAFKELHHDLRLIRIPLEKYQVAGDRKLSEPLVYLRSPERKGDVPHVYDKTDINRAHIMPMGLSERGAIQWLATDVSVKESRWIERQDLSDRFINLWGER
ncbi:hypothetical protein [Cupriavidus campinensis]|uniref:HNH endonuclease n=1 Tax=Cupriavidus campinensis TaxID=151783 RepID=A0ABY3EI80_9BURK|nr:hypothetical protein [Cupriavidus campinensis]TSP10644.1 hypothetical protein FGG12_21360 [Cupriavidus campinensis]